MNLSDQASTFADGAADPLDRAGAHVTEREDPGSLVSSDAFLRPDASIGTLLAVSTKHRGRL